MNLSGRYLPESGIARQHIMTIQNNTDTCLGRDVTTQGDFVTTTAATINAMSAWGWRKGQSGYGFSMSNIAGTTFPWDLAFALRP
jgi:hypothetical protein